MNEISGARIRRSLCFLLLQLISLSLQFVPGFSDGSESGKKPESHSASSSSSGSMAAIVVVVLAAVALVSFFAFKLWQKKKRDEQYARLLKLFEQDDELELELGLRD